MTNMGADRRSNNFAQTMSALLGAWLFLSVFVWPHSEVSRIDGWGCGVLVVAYALTGLKIPEMRWLNTAVGASVVFGAALLPHISRATEWNNLAVGLAILLVSLGGFSRAAPEAPHR